MARRPGMGLAIRLALFERDGGLCRWCRRPVWNPAKRRRGRGLLATADHMVPRVHGGTDKLANLALACEPCNLRRGAEVSP